MLRRKTTRSVLFRTVLAAGIWGVLTFPGFGQDTDPPPDAPGAAPPTLDEATPVEGVDHPAPDLAQPPILGPAPPTGLTVTDHGWDGGDRLDLSWTLSKDDPSEVKAYRIRRTLTAAEAEQENTDLLNQAIAAAKLAVTKRLFAVAGLELGTDPPIGMRARIRAERAAAASKARMEAERTIAAWADQERYKFLIFVPVGTTEFTAEKLAIGEAYRFQVLAVGRDGGESMAALSAPAVPHSQFFDGSRLPLFLIVSLICGAVFFFIRVARTGREMNIRKIAGLDAVQEAVGRATEMGRSVLFVPGIQDMNDIQTIAGLTVLSRVAKTAAEYDAKVEVPTTRSLVMTAARETVQASFLSAGRPDAYDESLIYYVTDEQFGYVAYLSGAMVREKPAACFYMGAFFAESLILAETGNSIGAIQVAGTAMPAQLPFFVAACDYTLIGEEFFAASAYLSGQADQLGSLKGQDVGKVVVATVMIIGVTLATLGNLLHSDSLWRAVEYLRGTLLT